MPRNAPQVQNRRSSRSASKTRALLLANHSRPEVPGLLDEVRAWLADRLQPS